MTPVLARLRNFLCLVAMTALLAACGGGDSPGGSNPPPTNPPPTNPPPTNPPPEEPGDDDEEPVTPDEIAFTSLDNVAPRLGYASETLLLQGIAGDEALAIGIEGDDCRLVINNEGIEGSSGELRNGDTLRVIAKASPDPGSSTDCVVDAGNGPVVFSVTTGPNNGTFQVMPGKVHTSWNAYNTSALHSYEIRGKLAGLPESGVTLVNNFSPEITSYTFEIISLDVDWGNDHLSVWACSNLFQSGITNAFPPCQALQDVSRKLEQPLSADAISYFKASNTHEEMSFGFAIVMNAAGDVMAISAPYENSASTGIDGDDSVDCEGGIFLVDEFNCAQSSGAVYVFRKVNGQWQQEAYIKASNTDAFDDFGYSLAMNAAGDVIAVGARREDSNATGIDGDQADNSALNSGGVYVFRYDGNTWSQDAYIKASNTDTGDEFGYAVALNASGDRLAVGAPWEGSNATGINGDEDNNAASNSGAVYLFEHDGDEWSQRAYVKRSVSNAGAHFGSSLALNAAGDVLIAGAPEENGGDDGAVYVFHETAGTWGEAARLQVADTSSFGSALSLDDTGNRLAVGTDEPAAPGTIFLYERSGGTWSTEPVAELQASNAHDEMYFGYSVVFSGNGNRLAVGAFGEGSPAIGINGDQTVTEDCVHWSITCPSVYSGAVYLFENTPGGWQQTHYLKAARKMRATYFGWVLAMNETGEVLAAAGDDHSAATGINGNPVDDCDADEPENCAQWSGAVYLFE